MVTTLGAPPTPVMLSIWPGSNPPSVVVLLVISVARAESVTTIPGVAGAALQLSLPLIVKESPEKPVSVLSSLLHFPLWCLRSIGHWLEGLGGRG